MSDTQQVLTKAIQQERKVLTVQESKGILENEGFPVNPTGFGQTLEEITSEADKIGFPIVLKVSSEDIIHKSDVGGVITGIRSKTDLQEQYGIMTKKISNSYPDAKIESYIVEKMESGIHRIIPSDRSLII